MEKVKHAKGETQSTRRTQERGGKGSPHSNREARVNPTGRQLPGQSGGADGEDWAGGNLALALAGGIVRQLRDDALKQLADMEECVKWYEDRVQEAQRRVEQFQEMVQLAGLEESPESPELEEQIN